VAVLAGLVNDPMSAVFSVYEQCHSADRVHAVGPVARGTQLQESTRNERRNCNDVRRSDTVHVVGQEHLRRTTKLQGLSLLALFSLSGNCCQKPTPKILVLTRELFVWNGSFLVRVSIFLLNENQSLGGEFCLWHSQPTHL